MLFSCLEDKNLLKKEDFAHARASFPQIMGNDFQTEVDFRSGYSFKSKSPELATFFDLTKQILFSNIRFYC